MKPKQYQVEKGVHTYRHTVYDPSQGTLVEDPAGQHYFLGRFMYCLLSSILVIGLLMLILIPIGSAFLYIDYKQQLVVKKSNKNDLCKSKCNYGAECIVDDYSLQSFCRCPANCVDGGHPVCGSDGVTYTDVCALHFESCNRQQPITVVSNSTCETKHCAEANCRWFERCQVDDKGRAKCLCDLKATCEHNQVEPVCASDGNIYSSLCALRKHNCANRTLVEQVDMHKCDTRGGGNGHGHTRTLNNHNTCSRCPPHAECVPDDTNKFVCRCPRNCTLQEESPVCGTNRQSYANLCQLKHEACSSNQTDLRLLHLGHCGECSERCVHYSQCQLNAHNIPECVCPQVCLRVDKPVCGSDGLTYENECELRVTSCRLQKEISIQFAGSCDLCHNVQCKHGSTCVHGECICPEDCEHSLAEPLCANDGNTYRNECEMNRMACKSKRELIALFYGKCEETNDSPNEEALSSDKGEDTDKAQCRQDCDAQSNMDEDDDFVYVCDNQVFATKCAMDRVACDRCNKFCHCNKYGLKDNARRLCNQASGQCHCKPGVTGLRCDQCPPNTKLTIGGCLHARLGESFREESCQNHRCHFGATCRHNGTHSQCWCNYRCDHGHGQQLPPKMLCASDGSTHRSMCHFNRYQCFMQKRLHLLKHCPALF